MSGSSIVIAALTVVLVLSGLSSATALYIECLCLFNRSQGEHDLWRRRAMKGCALGFAALSLALLLGTCIGVEQLLNLPPSR